ncbi:Ger(x)C family spore germination protein [Paenibacillus albus]|uniref:Ger(X)C family spore germination protein n=1 Tax=Paenibacillus albus TaxID=2495582 RepID=A0A3Q8X7D9_9BACL|nr:Ger(x)C family spore germination protein [Paenibacillus albus]AZN41730.1 Ger(x)C family spore germination protein [Paenibacillus albus]
MKRTVCLLMTICLFLTACAKQQILDRINLFIVASFDEVSKEQLEVTLAVPQFQAGKPEVVTDELYSKIGHTSTGIRESIGTQMDKPLQPGKLSVALFGSAKASSGIEKELDVLLRNAYFSRRMFLAVVDGKAKDLLREDFNKKDEKGMYLYHLLDANTRKGTLPGQNLHEFEYALVGQGLDPFLPIIQFHKDRIVVSGTALFKEDKYVTAIDANQSRLMKLLLEDMNQGIYEVKLDNGTFLAIENVGSTVKYLMKNAAITIRLTMNCKIREAEGYSTSDEHLRYISKRFKQQLLQSETELIKLFQKNAVDPLGLGDFARSRNRHWTEEGWMRQYPVMNVNVALKVNMMESGIRQ